MKQISKLKHSESGNTTQNAIYNYSILEMEEEIKIEKENNDNLKIKNTELQIKNDKLVTENCKLKEE